MLPLVNYNHLELVSNAVENVALRRKVLKALAQGFGHIELGMLILSSYQFNVESKVESIMYAVLCCEQPMCTAEDVGTRTVIGV